MSRESLLTPLVTTEWLADHLHEPWLRVVDASMYLPNAGRDARAEYTENHIPGAIFADIGFLSDETGTYPHTMPSAGTLASRLGSLGIGSNHAIVVYDTSGQNYSAPRVWWLLHIFGHKHVAILDGGMQKWVTEGRPTSSNVSTLPPASFEAQLDESRLRDISFMRDNVNSRADQVVDARSLGRFEATEPEPRPGLRGGHIPGSKSVHFAKLVNPDGTLRKADELRAIISDAGLDTSKTIVASCGTGVTACAVLFALHTLGDTNTALYDGSWTEWASAADTPVETGPSR